MIIRDECPADIDAIREVIESAFGRRAEADLVDRLRAEGDAVISLAAIEGDRIVGHVLFSMMNARFPALGLAPISVTPEYQRMGIGRRLIRAGLERAKTVGWKCVFALGNPAYYTRFGFDVSLARGFNSSYAGPHLMALALAPDVTTMCGEVEYAPAFRLLG